MGEPWETPDDDEGVEYEMTDAERASRRAYADVAFSGFKPRCSECGRLVSWKFRQLGLGVSHTEGREGPDGSYYVTSARHTYPCKGVKLQLKHVIAHLLSLADKGMQSSGLSPRSNGDDT